VQSQRREQIAEVLRRRLEELRARDGTGLHAPRQPPAAPSMDPMEVRRLAARWIAAHRGKRLADALGVRPDSAEDLLVVERTAPLRVARPSAQEVRDALASCLWLLPGVREATACRLAGQGQSRIEHLCDHPRHGRDASRVRRLMDRADAAGLMALISERAGRGHLHALRLSAFFDPTDLVFLDIETMGLFGGSPVILVGLAFLGGDGVRVRQLVAARPEAEERLIAETWDTLDRHRALVTFNGRAFDYPYLCQRAAYYGRFLGEEPVHFDLLPHARRVWRGRFVDCRLATLAREVLGLTREEDIPGALVPAFYQSYLEDPAGRVGLLAAIAAHNRDDMIQMVRLFEALLHQSEDLGPGR